MADPTTADPTTAATPDAAPAASTAPAGTTTGMVTQDVLRERIAQERTKLDTVTGELTQLQGQAAGWQALAAETDTAKARITELEAGAALAGKRETMLRAGITDGPMLDFLPHRHAGAGEEAGEFNDWFGTQLEQPYLSPFLRAAQAPVAPVDGAAPVNGNGGPPVAPVAPVVPVPDPTAAAAASSAPKTGGIDTSDLPAMTNAAWEEVRKAEIAAAFKR